MKDAANQGVRWAYGVLNHGLNLLGLLALLAAVSFVGIATDQPAWVIGGAVFVLVVVCLGEGAYRVWDATDDERERAESALATAAGATTLADWLGERIVEVRNLEATVGELLAHPGGVNRDTVQQRELADATFSDINHEVMRRLQSEAPDLVGYYSQNPDWYDPVVTRIGEDAFRELIRLMAYTVDQMAHVKEQVRK